MPPSTLLTTLLLISHPLLTQSTSTIPRSSSRSSHSSLSSSPPWNPSPKIDSRGFLNENYLCLPGEWESTPSTPLRPHRRRPFTHNPPLVTIRQVPGDGNCLFHSLSACLSYYTNKTHADMTNTTHLRETSSRLRRAAVDCLSLRPRRILFLQGGEYLRAKDLVAAAAGQYNMTGERYCELMRRESYWGGGPEIVALCNVLRRPIYVYELMARRSSSSGGDEVEERMMMMSRQEGCDGRAGRVVNAGFCLRRMACFGSPKFDRREPLHILSADSRFPDISPGRQLANGNHFLALFPLQGRYESGIRAGAIKKKKRRSRNVLLEEDEEIGDDSSLGMLLLDVFLSPFVRLFGSMGKKE